MGTPDFEDEDAETTDIQSSDDITDVGPISRRGLSRDKSRSSSTYTFKIGKIIARYVELGASLRAASKSAGLNPKTVFEWYRRGKGNSALPSQEKYVRFYRMIEKARGKSITNSLRRIEEAAKGGALVKRRVIPQKDGDPIVEESYAQPDAKMDTWLVSKLDRDRFGDHKKIEHSGDANKGSTTVNIQNNTNLTVGERLLLAKLLEKANAAQEPSMFIEKESEKT